MVQQWTRQHYVIRWGAAKYESYANMVEEDSNPMYALFHTNLANSIEEVSFAPIVVRPGYEGSSITEISSVPAGAQIAVDGVNAGVTPFKFWLMKKDQPRHITVSMPGYKPFEITTVPTGEPISIPVTLQPE